MAEQKKLRSDLTWHWIITGTMLSSIIVYNIVCHFAGSDITIAIAEEQRIIIRTTFYGIAIMLFPLVKLLRHILLRLNQTMPGSNPANFRYLMTILITLALIELVSLFGFVMFVLGDGFNTLYIFSILGLLGIYLHKPDQEEYNHIIEALKIKNS